MKIHLDKIASCTISANLDREVEISDDVRAELLHGTMKMARN